jgi:hypothetical protein
MRQGLRRKREGERRKIARESESLKIEKRVAKK